MAVSHATGRAPSPRARGAVGDPYLAPNQFRGPYPEQIGRPVLGPVRGRPYVQNPYDRPPGNHAHSYLPGFAGSSLTAMYGQDVNHGGSLIPATWYRPPHAHTSAWPPLSA